MSDEVTTEDLEKIMNNVQSRSPNPSTPDPFGSFSIVYKDSAGKQTERTVDIIRFNGAKRRFYAYCHLRKTFREFSFKGVVRMFGSDGEITDPQAFLLDMCVKAGEAIHLSEQNPKLDLIKSIWFFATCDGLYKRHELNAVKKHARRILPDIESKLGKDWLEKIKTSSEEMVEIIKRITMTDELVSLYTDAINELVDLKQKRYADMLSQNLLIELWPPFFQSASN